MVMMSIERDGDCAIPTDRGQLKGCNQVSHKTKSEQRDQLVATGWHYSFGWLRRPELDANNAGFTYEMPDGTLVVSREVRHRYGMHLDARRDALTGELYTSCSAVSAKWFSRRLF
jgi:hypothetical protein